MTVGADRALLLVALNMAVTRSRDTHSALCEGIGDYVECRAVELAAWQELLTALTDEPASADELEYVVSYPVPKRGESPCPSG